MNAENILLKALIYIYTTLSFRQMCDFSVGKDEESIPYKPIDNFSFNVFMYKIKVWAGFHHYNNDITKLTKPLFTFVS